MEGNVFFLLPFKVTPNYCTQSTRVWKKMEKQSTWISLIWKNHDACFPWFPISVWPDQQKWNQIWDGHWAMLIPKTDQIWMAMDQQLLIIPYFRGTRGRAFINPSYFGVRSIPGSLKFIPLQLKFMTHSRRGYTNKMRGTSLAKLTILCWENMKKHGGPTVFAAKTSVFDNCCSSTFAGKPDPRNPPCRCSTARRNREESERADHQSRVTLAQLAAELTIEKPSYS